MTMWMITTIIFACLAAYFFLAQQEKDRIATDWRDAYHSLQKNGVNDFNELMSLYKLTAKQVKAIEKSAQFAESIEDQIKMFEVMGHSELVQVLRTQLERFRAEDDDESQ